MEDQNNYSKYNVPPFGVNESEIKLTYTWWSWHPLWDKWLESCWKADTIEDALKLIEDGGLSYYHNKLIKHDINGYEEVFDAPCKRLDIWDKCIENKKNGLYDRK